MSYYISETIETNYEDAVQKVTESLSKIGFGIITEIDMHQKLKEKIDVDINRYKILGACNPHFAHKALLLNDKIGVFLPCNIIIQELEENKVEVSAINPNIMADVLQNVEFEKMAKEVTEQLKTAIKI